MEDEGHEGREMEIASDCVLREKREKDQKKDESVRKQEGRRRGALFLFNLAWRSLQ